MKLPTTISKLLLALSLTIPAPLHAAQASLNYLKSLVTGTALAWGILTTKNKPSTNDTIDLKEWEENIIDLQQWTTATINLQKWANNIGLTTNQCQYLKASGYDTLEELINASAEDIEALCNNANIKSIHKAKIYESLKKISPTKHTNTPSSAYFHDIHIVDKKEVNGSKE